MHSEAGIVQELGLAPRESMFRHSPAEGPAMIPDHTGHVGPGRPGEPPGAGLCDVAAPGSQPRPGEELIFPTQRRTSGHAGPQGRVNTSVFPSFWSVQSVED